jgi:hypothetical protein
MNTDAQGTQNGVQFPLDFLELVNKRKNLRENL